MENSRFRQQSSQIEKENRGIKQVINDMKMIGEDKLGNVVYNELHCDVCERMSGPRSRYDDCLNCGATREERIKAGHIILADLFLSNYKNNMIAEANRLKEKYSELEIKINVEFDIS